MIDLREAIATQLAAHPGQAPHDTANAVVEKIPAQELREALRVVLPLLVMRVQSQQRVEDAPAVPAIEGPRPARPTGQTLLDRTVCVKPKTWKALGDCGPNDLRRMARFSEGLVEQHTVWARRYAHLADAVHQAGEKRVRDIDFAVVRSIFT